MASSTRDFESGWRSLRCASSRIAAANPSTELELGGGSADLSGRLGKAEHALTINAIAAQVTNFFTARSYAPVGQA
jgi:hypothetical protein